MSCPDDGHHTFFPFGNPFKMIRRKGSYISPELLILLNSFEEALAERFKKLKPKENTDVLSLSWMTYAMESLSETHTDIKSLITDLQFPISDWEEQWMDMYLDNSVKLLDMCIAFSSELSHLDQGQLFLRYALNLLDPSNGSPSEEHLRGACRSLHGWVQQINLRSPKFANSFYILQELGRSLYPTKVKNSAKGKVLMQAMYGVKVQTIFTCSALAAALSGSDRSLMDLHVSDKVLWGQTFKELQDNVNGEIRNIVSCGKAILLKEVEAVCTRVEKLLNLTRTVGFYVDKLQRGSGFDLNEPEVQLQTNGIVQDKIEVLQECRLDLDLSTERLAYGLDRLSKQVGDFFQIVLTGRDALLCNLRSPDPVQEDAAGESRL